jgi:hypothetical protein
MKRPNITYQTWVLIGVVLGQLAFVTTHRTPDLINSELGISGNSMVDQFQSSYRKIEGRILAKHKFSNEMEEEVTNEELPDSATTVSDSRESERAEDKSLESSNERPIVEKSSDENMRSSDGLASESKAVREKTDEQKDSKKNNEDGKVKKRKSKKKTHRYSKKKGESKTKELDPSVEGQKKDAKPAIETVDGNSSPTEVPLPKNFPNLHLIINENRIRSCNIKLINSFGMEGPKVAQPEESEASLLKYCPKNRWTCCNHRHVESSRSFFAKGQKSLNHLFRMVEVMLTFFRGKMYKHVLRDMANMKECHYVLEEYENFKSPEEFFSDDYVEIQLKEIQNLLNELPTYIRNELSFYGSLVCTICDAHDNLSFSVEESGTKIFAHSDTCNSIIDNSQFMINYAYLFFEFIEPLTKIIKCARNLNDDLRYASSSSSLKPLIKLEQNIDECKKSANKNIPACQKVCNKSLHSYELIRPLTRSNIRAALRVLFYEFMEIDADDFEWTTRKSKLDDPQFESIHFFNPLDYDFRNYRIDEPEWYFHERASRTMYNTMASYYFTTQGIGRMFASVAILAALVVGNI